MQTVTGKKIEIPAEWSALGARLGDLVNVIAERDDLISRVFPGNSSPGAQQAAAWFVPSQARVNIDADKVLPGVHPDDVDLYTPQGQATHMALMGALTHECAHAAHTVLKFTKEHKTKHVDWAILLEETRIEKKALARRPQDRPFLAACATELVFGGNLTMERKNGKHTPASLARSAILLLGRADAGVFDADDLTTIQDYFEAEFGQDEAAQLREIWLKAQELEDGDLDSLVACGKEVYDLLNEHPDAPEEPQQSQQPQQGGGSDDNDGQPGDSGDSSGDSGGSSSGEADDSSDASGEGAGSASGDSNSKSDSKGGSGASKGAQGVSDDAGDDSSGGGAAGDDETDDKSDDDGTAGGQGSKDNSDNDTDADEDTSGSGDGSDEDEEGEAFQMPCGSWTEGNIGDDEDEDGDSDGNDDKGNGDADTDNGSGSESKDGSDDMADAIKSAMKKISVDAKRDVTLTLPVRRNLNKQREEAKREKREYIRNKNTAERVFRAPKAGAPGLLGNHGKIKVFQQKPTDADKRNANMLTKELRKAQHRDIHRTKVPSFTPPGRMLINEAARRDAQRARGEEITAMPWRQTRRRMVQSPPLLVGLSVDVSMSMDAWQYPVAAFGWALANAVRTLEGKIASVAWNGNVKSVMFPGKIYKDVQVAQAGGISTGLATSLDALDGEIDLARSEGVRVQVILTDGQIDESGIQERIDRLTRAGVLVIWIETPSSAWWGSQEQFGGYVPKGVKHLPLKDPNVFGQVVGRFIADALSQHQGNA